MAELRARLMLLRSELQDRLQRIRRDIRRAGQPLDADFAEQATQRQNDEVLEQLEAATVSELEDVLHALLRLDAGRYGTCAECGGAIDPARLEARPAATTCADCAAAQAA